MRGLSNYTFCASRAGGLTLALSGGGGTALTSACTIGLQSCAIPPSAAVR
jgi:hypothetical protein